jgi:hypothetical protein
MIGMLAPVPKVSQLELSLPGPYFRTAEVTVCSMNFRTCGRKKSIHRRSETYSREPIRPSLDPRTGHFNQDLRRLNRVGSVNGRSGHEVRTFGTGRGTASCSAGEATRNFGLSGTVFRALRRWD